MRSSISKKKNLPPLGIDLVEIKKAGIFYAEHKDRLGLFFSLSEIRHIKKDKRPHEAMGLLLAAKEAVFKAMQREWMGPAGFKKIRIIPKGSGTFSFELREDYSGSVTGKARGFFFKGPRYVGAFVNIDENRKSLL